MIGTSAAPGVMVHTVRDIFNGIEERRGMCSYKVSMTYLEVYNETIRDLLAESNKPLKLCETSAGDMIVSGLRSETPSNAIDVFSMLDRGNKKRTQCATDANSQSSRSHAVLQVTVTCTQSGAANSTQITTGKLSLIDLAGSERAAVSNNRGTILKEGANINRSLLALGNCINALTKHETNTKDSKNAAKYVPYRDSKLTRLLKDSLGGNCRTVMIAAVSASSLSSEDSHNTLKYANRAKDIKTKITKNITSLDYHLKDYKKIIENLTTQAESYKKKWEEALKEMTFTRPREENYSALAVQFRAQITNLFEERNNLEQQLTDNKNQLMSIGFELDLHNSELNNHYNSVESRQNNLPNSPQHIKSLRRTITALEAERKAIISNNLQLSTVVESNKNQLDKLMSTISTALQQDQALAQCLSTAAVAAPSSTLVRLQNLTSLLS
jgi:kinesin family protein 18/19